MSLHHALRTAAGSPSDPYWSNTSLLLLGNGTNGGQNNTFIDSSSNAFTITRYGNVTQGSFSPFTIATGTEYSTGTNGGSGYFDGSGDYLSVPDNAAFEIGSGDFTVEAWIYLTGYSPGYSGYYVAQIVTKDNNNDRGFAFDFSGTSTSWTTIGAILFTSNTTYVQTTVNYTFNLQTWYHVAWVRNGSSLRIYVNGTDVGGGTNNSNVQNTTTSVTIGAESAYWASQGYGYYFPGYISNLRFVKGSAVYTANFTPSTTPLTAITNTSLLLNFTNASIIDSTGKNDLETVGDAQISTSTKKFGTGSLKFDGTDDALSFPSGSHLAFGTGDYTVEGWFYLSSTTSYRTIFVSGTAGSSGNFACYFYNGTTLEIYQNGVGPAKFSGSCSVSTNTWFHLAITRSSGTVKVFLDGVQQSSGTDTYSYASTSNARVGNDGIGGYYFTGYIDDLRITKGVARYTAAFTPPSRQLPAR